MAKTALDLTPHEWQAYRPDRVTRRVGRSPDPGIRLRRRQAWRVARRAARVLREQFGAQRVVLFGSLTQREWFTEWSDIDLAAWGIPDERFYQAVTAVSGLSPLFRVELVDPAACRLGLRQTLENEGIEL